MSIGTLGRGNKFFLPFSDVEGKIINLLPICLQQGWQNSLLCVNTNIFRESFFFSFFPLLTTIKKSRLALKNFSTGLSNLHFFLGVERKNLRKKSFFFEKVMCFAYHSWIMSKKIFRCLPKNFRMSIETVFFVSIRTLTRGKNFLRKSTFFYHFRTLGEVFCLFVKTLTSELSKLRSPCPEEHFDWSFSFWRKYKFSMFLRLRVKLFEVFGRTFLIGSVETAFYLSIWTSVWGIIF